MKTFFTALMLVSSMSSFACNLSEIQETQSKTVYKTFDGSAFCLKGVYCSENNAKESAAKKGYVNCRHVSESEGGLNGVSSSYKYTLRCEKEVSVKLSSKELRTQKCTKLFQCAQEETGNTSLILEMFDKLKCEKYL